MIVLVVAAVLMFAEEAKFKEVFLIPYFVLKRNIDIARGCIRIRGIMLAGAKKKIFRICTSLI